MIAAPSIKHKHKMETPIDPKTIPHDALDTVIKMARRELRNGNHAKIRRC